MARPPNIYLEVHGGLFVGDQASQENVAPPFWVQITGYDGSKYYSWVEQVRDGSTFTARDGGRSGTTTVWPAWDPNGKFVPTGAYVLLQYLQVDPLLDQVYAIVGGAGTGSLPTINYRVYTADDVWVKPAGLSWIEVEVLGGGGGGGGGPAGPVLTQAGGAGGGGAAGGYSYSQLPASVLLATETVTVGAGGVGVTTGSPTGGGTSSFGAHLSAGGGAPGFTGTVCGAGQPTNAWITGRALGSVGVGGSINSRGSPAEPGVAIYDGTILWLQPGIGGSTQYGGGGSPIAGALGTTTGGNTALGYGAGGSGGSSDNQGHDGRGGDGAGGIVIVREYIGFGP